MAARASAATTPNGKVTAPQLIPFDHALPPPVTPLFTEPLTLRQHHSLIHLTEAGIDLQSGEHISIEDAAFAIHSIIDTRAVEISPAICFASEVSVFVGNDVFNMTQVFQGAIVSTKLSFERGKRSTELVVAPVTVDFKHGSSLTFRNRECSLERCGSEGDFTVELKFKGDADKAPYIARISSTDLPSIISYRRFLNSQENDKAVWKHILECAFTGTDFHFEGYKPEPAVDEEPIKTPWFRARNADLGIEVRGGTDSGNYVVEAEFSAGRTSAQLKSIVGDARTEKVFIDGESPDWSRRRAGKSLKIIAAHGTAVDVSEVITRIIRSVRL